MSREIKTPTTDPDHDTVGNDFLAHGYRWYCDSYDSAIGFWMTRLDAPKENWNDQYGEWRRNVSPRAIGRTFWQVYHDFGREHVTGGAVIPRPPGGPGEAEFLAKRARESIPG